MIQHPDPEVQAIISMLQDSLDVATVNAAKLAATNARLVADVERLTKEVADRDAALLAAGEAQAAHASAEVIQMGSAA